MPHTPGPWINCNNHVDDASGLTLFRSTRTFDDLNPFDFRLAAAAPDLLAACKNLLALSIPADICGHPMVKEARRAIANAQAD